MSRWHPISQRAGFHLWPRGGDRLCRAWNMERSGAPRILLVGTGPTRVFDAVDIQAPNWQGIIVENLSS